MSIEIHCISMPDWFKTCHSKKSPNQKPKNNPKKPILIKPTNQKNPSYGRTYIHSFYFFSGFWILRSPLVQFFSIVCNCEDKKHTYLQKWHLLLSCISMSPVSGNFKEHLRTHSIHSDDPAQVWYRLCVNMSVHFLSICHDLSLKLWIRGTAELLLWNM